MRELINNRFGRWLRYQSHKAIKQGRKSYGSPTYTWVAEAGNHFHWCLYVPEELREEFEEKLPTWISKDGTIFDKDRCINIKEIYALMGLARYCMKGIDPTQAKRRHIHAEEQGIVYGKRVAISRNLGGRSRKKLSKVH